MKDNETEEEWDEEECDELEHSSAYTQCYIEGRPTPAIVDSRAGGVILSEATMKELGWRIEAPIRQMMIVTDGHCSRPLGRVFELPIQFGPMIIPITAIVVDTDSYDLVLGNTWLRKVRAILDFGALKMRFTWKGRTFDVSIDIHRGIRPRFIDDEEDGEYNVVQVTNKPPGNKRRYLTTEERNEVMT